MKQKFKKISNIKYIRKSKDPSEILKLKNTEIFFTLFSWRTLAEGQQPCALAIPFVKKSN